MKRLGLLAVVLAVVLSGTAAWADSEFYVIAGGGPPVGTKITSVPYEINNPGFYYLGGNLSYNGSGNAITVSADNVTIDLMGFSLANNLGAGITKGICINGRANVEVRNGTVRGFSTGVYDTSGNRHRAINVRANRNDCGILFYGDNHLIKGCNGSNNREIGIVVNSGIIADCVASNNATGIKMVAAGNVLGNTAINNSANNFYLGDGKATSIMVDRNSAFGLAANDNYCVPYGTTGVEWGINAGRN